MSICRMEKVCQNTEQFGLRMLRVFPFQCVLGMDLPKQCPPDHRQPAGLCSGLSDGCQKVPI